MKAETTEVGRNLIIQNSRSTPVIKGFCGTNGQGYTPQLKDDFEVPLWHSHSESRTNWTNKKSNKLGVSETGEYS